MRLTMSAKSRCRRVWWTTALGSHSEARWCQSTLFKNNLSGRRVKRDIWEEILSKSHPQKPSLCVIWFWPTLKNNLSIDERYNTKTQRENPEVDFVDSTVNIAGQQRQPRLAEDVDCLDVFSGKGRRISMGFRQCLGFWGDDIYSMAPWIYKYILSWSLDVSR